MPIKLIFLPKGNKQWDIYSDERHACTGDKKLTSIRWMRSRYI